MKQYLRAMASMAGDTVDEAVPVNPEGHIANGAHRLAAALYHQRPINIRNTNPDENNYVESDYEYFVKRGLSQSIVKRTALERRIDYEGTTGGISSCTTF